MSAGNKDQPVRWVDLVPGPLQEPPDPASDPIPGDRIANLSSRNQPYLKGDIEARIGKVTEDEKPS